MRQELMYIGRGLAVIGSIVGVLGVMALLVWLGTKYETFAYVLCGSFFVIMIVIIARQLGEFVSEGR